MRLNIPLLVWIGVLTLVAVPLLSVPLVKGAQKTIPLTPAAEPPVGTQALEPLLEPLYEKPIIFFREEANILVFHPNGDIIHRGRKVTNDHEIVLALQELLSLSPCH